MNRVEFYTRYNEVSKKVLSLEFNTEMNKVKKEEEKITTSREVNKLFAEVVKDELAGKKVDLLV